MISIQQWAKWMNKGSASIPYVLLENYKKLQLSDAEMMLILHLHSFAGEGNRFPGLEQFQERMSCSEPELMNMLNRLRKEGFIEIHPSLDEEGSMTESYSLEPLWQKLMRYICLSTDTSVEQEVASAADAYPAWPSDMEDQEDLKKIEGEVYRRFEQEFGRPLSPIECETIALWIDEDRYESHLIFLALREAVISNKLSLRYIDRILFEWQKNGISTPEQVREHSKKFRQPQISKAKSKDPSQQVEFSFYNWLEK
jgi:DNA replication protein